MIQPYRILERKRGGAELSEEEIRAVVDGAASGEWGDDQLAAFLMAAAIRGLMPVETRALTLAMLESGERWELGRELPTLGDKHSTGGVGDKVSLILAPVLAACGQPVVMLTGRGLGHTGGTADKLEGIPGIDLQLDRSRCLAVLNQVGLAIGVATAAIAPADRRLYAIRDRTATVESLQLITASILSKKLATGAAAVVFDVKTGEGAFLREEDEARRLGRLLVETCAALDRRASAVITDMSQPLGRWVGHHAELRETFDCLSGDGPREVMEVVFALAEELTALTGVGVGREQLERAVSSGSAREAFEKWAAAQGGDPSWLTSPRFHLAPEEVVVSAERDGVLARVATRRLGLLLAEAGAGRSAPGGGIDHGVALDYCSRLGRRVEQGEALARLYLRRRDEELVGRFASCFSVSDSGAAPELVRGRVDG